MDVTFEDAEEKADIESIRCKHQQWRMFQANNGSAYQSHGNNNNNGNSTAITVTTAATITTMVMVTNNPNWDPALHANLIT